MTGATNGPHVGRAWLADWVVCVLFVICGICVILMIYGISERIYIYIYIYIYMDLVGIIRFLQDFSSFI